MAAGTITNVAVDPHTAQAVPIVLGDLKMTISTVPGNTSYSTGGDAITGAQLGLPTGTLLYAFVVQVAGSAANNAAVQAYFNNATGKLQFFSGTTLAETVGTTNVSGVTATIVAFGY